MRKNGVYADILEDLEKGTYEPIAAKRRVSPCFLTNRIIFIHCLKPDAMFYTVNMTP